MDFNRLVTAVTPFIEKTVNRFSKCPATQDDLRQEALLACWRVSERYALADVEVARTAIRAIYNAAVSHHRKENQFKVKLHTELGSSTPSVLSEEINYNRVEDADLIAAITKEVELRDREVFADLQAGLTPSESADFRGRVRCNVSRSIGRIRDAAARHIG